MMFRGLLLFRDYNAYKRVSALPYLSLSILLFDGCFSDVAADVTTLSAVALACQSTPLSCHF